MTIEADANVAALLTPPGVGAIAVIRIHGPRVQRFLEECFSCAVIAGRCVHGELRDGEKVIDDPVVVLATNGRAADINLHGGSWIVLACLELARRNGFSVIAPGDPPFLSFMLDGQDELENEILAHLPLAATEMALTVLLAQRAAWKALKPEQLGREAAARILADRSLHWLLHPPRVAVAGIPNAGKSTLANQLFGRQRSITADQPGTTRDWVGETANLDGLAVTLVDTPGIRVSVDPIETLAIERAQKQLQRADAIVLVLDATRSADPEQRSLVDRFPGAIRVANKIDGSEATFSDDRAIPTVAMSGQGVDAVRRAIRAAFQCEPIDLRAVRCWTDRQRRLLQINENP